MRRSKDINNMQTEFPQNGMSKRLGHNLKTG